MFTDFFYLLRKRKVPVSITEWMTLMEALSRGLVTNLDEFYYLARAVLVKSETYFDQYDVAFQEFFTGIEFPSDISQKILEWLKDPIKRNELTEEERALLAVMDFDELVRRQQMYRNEESKALESWSAEVPQHAEGRSAASGILHPCHERGTQWI